MEEFLIFLESLPEKVARLTDLPHTDETENELLLRIKDIKDNKIKILSKDALFDDNEQKNFK